MGMLKDYVDEYQINEWNLDPYYPCKVEYVDAAELFVSTRADFIGRLTYIDSKVNHRNTDFAKKLYIESIRLGIECKFVESSSEWKNSVERYIEVFDHMIEEIPKTGLLSEISVVPVTQNGVIINGYHRVSIAIYFNLKVPIVRLPLIATWTHDLQWFEDRGLDKIYVDYIKGFLDDNGGNRLFDRQKVLKRLSMINASDYPSEYGETVHVCYAIYDATGNFSKITAASILSIFMNTKAWVTVHLLHDNTLSDKNKSRFMQMARQYSQNIIFYNVAELLPDSFKLIGNCNNGRFSPAAMYRLVMMKVIPHTVPKVIYLDSDTIINLDVQELYNEPVGDNGVAAVAELEMIHCPWDYKAICNDGTVARENYFCSGIMMFDMDKYGTYPDILTDGLKILAKHPEYNCHDQDILNYYFADKYYHLPIKYNNLVHLLRYSNADYQNCIHSIFHYAVNSVLLIGTNDIYNKLFFDYYVKTPWFNGSLFLKAVAYGMDMQHRLDIQLLNIFRTRTVVFCGASRDQLQGIQNMGYNLAGTTFLNILEDKNTVNAGKILGFMNSNQDKNCFLFIMLGYPQIKGFLQQHGLQDGRDFWNIEMLLKVPGEHSRGALNFI